MQPLVMVVLESTLTFGVPVGLAVAELIHLNRRPPPPPDDRTKLPPPPPPPAPREKASPAVVRRVRELEDA